MNKVVVGIVLALAQSTFKDGTFIFKSQFKCHFFNEVFHLFTDVFSSFYFTLSRRSSF